MSDSIKLTYTVTPDDFSQAGAASSAVKQKMKQLDLPRDAVRKVAIAMYEGEINMIIHADGGEITVTISPDEVEMVLADRGPGIEDIEKAKQAGYSTAPEKVRELGFGAGMGLPNMIKYSDAFHIESEVGVGTTITMKVFLEPG